MENRAAGNSALVAALGKSFPAAVTQRRTCQLGSSENTCKLLKLRSRWSSVFSLPGMRGARSRAVSFRQIAPPGASVRSPVPSPSRPERQPQVHLSSPTHKSLNSLKQPLAKRQARLSIGFVPSNQTGSPRRLPETVQPCGRPLENGKPPVNWVRFVKMEMRPNRANNLT
jgi:hypothetical protein